MISQSPGFFLQRRDGVERPSTWRGRRYWVVSRGLCGFRVFQPPNNDRATLKDFAAVKAREWAPFAEVAYHLHLTGDAVRIWTWDGARTRGAMSATGVDPRRVTVLPETALYERGEDGLHLIECVEGFEGQFWSDGELTASRWWPAPPSLAQWIDFQRGGGIQPSGDAPPVEAPVWRRRAWTDSGASLAFGIESRGRELILVGTGALIVGYGYFGGALIHDALSLSAVEARLQRAEQQAAPVLADRDRARSNEDFLANFAELNPFPSQFELFAKVAEKLPTNGARIVGWSYQQGELQFTIFSPSSIDILFYVKTYSAVDGFTDVTAKTGEVEQTLRIKLRVAK
jgi:hypothetical protein